MKSKKTNNQQVGVKLKLIFMALCLFFSTLISQAQDSIRISGQLQNNTRFAKVVVQKFGVGFFDITAVPIDKDSGTFSIMAPMDVEAGVYRLRYSQSSLHEYVDVIVNGQEKEIHFTLDLLPEITYRKPVFQTSEANRSWYNFLEIEKQTILKTDLLGQLLAAWPNINDSLFLSFTKERAKLIAYYWHVRQKYLNDEPDFWAHAMVANKRPYFAEVRQDWRLQDFYKRQQYWQGLQSDTPELLNTPLFTNLILEYIQYYMHPEMEFTNEQMQAGFIKSVDTIMLHFSENEAMRNFAIQYLQMGFKEIGMEEVLQYIDQTYAAGQCTEGMEDDVLQQRLKGYEALKAGSPAIDIQWAGEDGSLASLYDLQAESILVVFWASWCHHCMEMMPELNEWAADRPQLQVLAVSLDQDAGAYLEAAQEFDNLLHYNDYQGWSSKPAKDYFVYGTPTFMLIDNQKRIIAKYVSFQTLRSEMQ